MTPRSPRVLVVDDDGLAAAVYQSALEIEGYRVEVAENGFEALKCVERERPDLIVLDLIMPVMDGWQVLDHLRALPGAPPVLVVSASADLARAEKAGATACFSKPFGIAAFRRACAELVTAPAEPAD